MILWAGQHDHANHPTSSSLSAAPAFSDSDTLRLQSLHHVSGCLVSAERIDSYPCGRSYSFGDLSHPRAEAFASDGWRLGGAERRCGINVRAMGKRFRPARRES